MNIYETASQITAEHIQEAIACKHDIECMTHLLQNVVYAAIDATVKDLVQTLENDYA